MKMSYRLAFSILIIMTFIFQTYSGQARTASLTVTSDNSGFPQIDLGPGFNHSEINIGYKFYNQSVQSNYSIVASNWLQNFGINTSALSGSITSTEVAKYQVMTIFNSQSEAATSEVDAIRGGLNQGKGLLYLVNGANASQSAQNFFDTLFQTSVVSFTNHTITSSTYSGSNPYVVATEFSSPITPVTANITKVVFPNTVGMTINKTAIPQSNLTIKDIYPVVFDSNQNQALGVAIELAYYGRIIILGSSEVISNDMYQKTGIYKNMFGLSNEKFENNIIQWLGRETGYFHMLSHALNVGPDEQISRGKVINGTFEFTDQYNKSLTDVQVRFRISITKEVIDYNYMSYLGNSTYFGSISTKDALIGLKIDISAQLMKRGFVDQVFPVGRVYIKLEFAGPSLPDLSIGTILIAGIIIYSLSAAYVWKEFKKTGL